MNIGVSVRTGGDTRRYFDGLIDEVAIYRRVLTEVEIQEIMEDGVVPRTPPKPTFHRGDANGDGAVNLADALSILNFLFIGGASITCLEAANPNDDDGVNLADPLSLLNFLFLGGPPPSDPGPPALPCGPDPADSPQDLGCESYAPCAG